MKKIVLTGASGFIGGAVLTQLEELKYSPVKIFRSNSINVPSNNVIIINNIVSTTDWKNTFNNCEVVIHCAARTHIMNNTSLDLLTEFKEVNTYGTLNLARQAADVGVKRFIFISSIKVNGESTELGSQFKPDDNFIPTDPYGLSKYEAEVGLRKIAEDTGMEVVIIRPPLVYGPGVKGNFASMIKWMNKGFPLPFGGIKENRRSLVSIANLVDLMITCIEHPSAANQTFLVSDDSDVSTSQLLANMALALDVPNRLLPIPSSWFILATKLIGKPAISQRLCGSLQVDISRTKELLDWQPPHSSVECMKKTANFFLESLSSNK